MKRKTVERVLVTGATGFIGGHICEALHHSGYVVRATYRRKVIPRFLKELANDGVQLTQCDLRDESCRNSITHDMDAVVHAAGLVEGWEKLKDSMRINYEVTVNLLDVARHCGCKVFLYISSTTVHGFGNHIDSTEDGPYYALRFPYQVSKKLADDYVLSQNSKDFRTTVVRPGNVYGPRDTTTFDKLFDALRVGFMPYIDGGKYLTAPVYIDNLIEGIIRILSNNDSGGQAFILTDGDRITWKEFLEQARKCLGVKHVWLHGGPFWLAWIIVWILDLVFRTFGITAILPLTPGMVDHASHNYSFNIDKARKVLGYDPQISWQEGVLQTVRAYLAQKSM